MQLKELSVSSHQQQAEEEKQISFHPSYLYLQRKAQGLCESIAANSAWWYRQNS